MKSKGLGDTLCMLEGTFSLDTAQIRDWSGSLLLQYEKDFFFFPPIKLVSMLFFCCHFEKKKHLLLKTLCFCAYVKHIN